MKNIMRWQWIGLFFTVVVGALLHFVYDWSGANPLVAAFSPVNESTWEHLKLLITPMLLFGAAEYLCYGRGIPNFVPVRLLSILLGMAAVITLFYTYTGIAGTHCLWADIAVFVIAVAMAYRFSAKLLGLPVFCSQAVVRASWAGLVLLVASVVLFSYNPPDAALFADPLAPK